MSAKKKEKNKPVPRSSRYGHSSPTFNNRSLEGTQMTLIPLGQRQPIEGLTVVGEATRDPLPDIVELGFEIHAMAYSAALAVQEVGAKIKQIRQGLTRVADGQTELQSGGVAVWPI